MTEVVAALIFENGRFFVGKRPPHKARALLYEFVGGKVEPGETNSQALMRELREEMAMKTDITEDDYFMTVIHQYPDCREELGCEVCADSLYTDVIHEYPDLTVHLSVYLAHFVSGEPQLLEHVEFRWILPEEIVPEEFCPADKIILEKIQADFGGLHVR